jgi:hypothetical protein
MGPSFCKCPYYPAIERVPATISVLNWPKLPSHQWEKPSVTGIRADYQ